MATFRRTQVTRELWERFAAWETPDPEAGQVWRLRWSDIVVLAVIEPRKDPRTFSALPISEDPQFATDSDLILEPDESPLRMAAMVQVGLEMVLHHRVLDRCLGRIADRAWKDLLQLRAAFVRSEPSGLPLGRVGPPVTHELDERLQYRAEQREACMPLAFALAGRGTAGRGMAAAARQGRAGAGQARHGRHGRDDGKEQVVSDITPVVIKRLQEAEIEVRIEGITPLIPHRWSEKAREMMREKQSGKTRPKHPPKDPAADAESALYRLADGRPGMPATAFKAATIGACSLFGKDVTKVVTKQVIHFVGEGPEQLVPIDGELELREDMPRNNSGTPDLRYRYQLWPWSSLLVVRFLPQVLTAESVITLIDAGGRGGVGDWRPSSPRSCTGTYGQYRVVEG